MSNVQAAALPNGQLAGSFEVVVDTPATSAGTAGLGTHRCCSGGNTCCAVAS